MRVTSSSDQLRMAVTECRDARSFCANNIVAEIASAASGFIPWRLPRDVAHGTVRLDYFHDVGGTCFLGLDGLRRRGRPNSFGGTGLLGQFQLPPHQGHVILSLGERRHPAVARHCAFAGIVCRQRQRVVVFVKIEQVAQIFGPALDVLNRVEGIADAETPRRGGNQLHQSQCALTGNRVRVVVALHFDHRMDQLRRQRVFGGNPKHRFVNAGRRRDGFGSREAAPTTRGGTTASATLTSLTGLGLTTMLLTNFPVRRSGRTTLVTRCGLSGPAPNSTPTARPATISLKHNWRKMFPLILSPKSGRRAAGAPSPGPCLTEMGEASSRWPLPGAVPSGPGAVTICKHAAFQSEPRPSGSGFPDLMPHSAPKLVRPRMAP